MLNLNNTWKLNLNNIISFLILLIVPAMLTGPFFPDLLLTISIILFLTGYKKLNINFKRFFFNKFSLFFLIFCIYISVRSIFTEEQVYSLKSSLFYFRFYIFSIVIWYLLESNKNFFKLFVYILFVTFIFVLFDTQLQYHLGTDVFGYKKLANRLSGPFGDELIVGSYLSKVMPLLAGILAISLFKNKIFTLIPLIFFIVFTIFLTGERTALAYSLIFSLIFFFQNKFKYKYIITIISFFLLSVSIFIVLQKNLAINDRFIKHPICAMNLNNLNLFKFIDCPNSYKSSNDLNEVNKKIFIFSEAHTYHYLSAFEIFKKNKIFGSGLKMYRFECRDETVYVNPMSCTTHPHNIFMQFIAELGLVGLFFYVVIFTFIIFEIFKNFFRQNNILIICCLSSFFLSLFPFLPSGNFFNNYNSILAFFPLGFYFYEKNKLKK